jgi:hypothetical protein
MEEQCIIAQAIMNIGLDVMGKELSRTSVRSWSAGRSTVSFGIGFPSGIYLVKANGNSGEAKWISTFVK